MQNVEFKLKSGEFKFLQYLKTLDTPKGLDKISDEIDISIRSLRNMVRVLEGLYVIEVNRTASKPNEYIINDYNEWNVH